MGCHRRELIHAVTLPILFLSGCSTIKYETGLTEEELGQVTLANHANRSFKVRVEIVRDDKKILSSEYNLKPGSPEEKPQKVLYKWGDNAGAQEWTVRAKTRVGDWQEAVMVAGAGAECHSVKVITGDWSNQSVVVLPNRCDKQNG